MSPPRRNCRGPFSRGAEAAAVSAFGLPRISASGSWCRSAGTSAAAATLSGGPLALLRNFRDNVWNVGPAKFIIDVLGRGGRCQSCVLWKETPMKLPVKTIGATLVAASVALASPAEARWRGWGWGGLGIGLAAGAIIGSTIAASAYPYGYGYGYRAYGYGYGYPAYGYGYPAYGYGYGYPAYRVAYAYPSLGYGYYPRRAYSGYAYAPRYASYPRGVYRASAFAPGRVYRRWR